MTRRRWVALLPVVVVLAAACSGNEAPAPTSPAPMPTPTAQNTTELPVIEVSYDPTQPWAITAIDYHFHDAHPTPELNPNGVLIFRNQGTNTHNVTIEGTTYSHDIKPGQTLIIDPISSVMPHPGTYVLICKYHVDRGMKGEIIVGTG